MPSILWRVGPLAWRHSTLLPPIQKAAYASSSNSLAISISDVRRVLKTPLPGINTLNLSTHETWAKWTTLGDEPQETKKQYEQQCTSELRHILGDVQQHGGISKMTFELKDVLELPIQHTKNEASPFSLLCRSPVSIFEVLDLECVCRDLVLWELSTLPLVEIVDSTARYALLKAREFGQNTGAWHEFVSKTGDTVLQAFDYTADFHSRDLDESSSQKTLVDLGVFGQGFPRIDGVDIDSFSVGFSKDMEGNLAYFKKNAWRSGMYAEARRRDSWVSSQAGMTSPAEEQSYSVGIDFDRPFWQIPEKLLRDCVAKLKVGEDEELVWEERGVSKRKKTNDRSE